MTRIFPLRLLSLQFAMPLAALATLVASVHVAAAEPAASGSSEPAAAAAGENAKAPAPAASEPAKTEAQGLEGNLKDSEIVLTPEEKAEKEGRKACKVEICAAFRNPSAAGSDISCDVLKSWRKDQLVKMVSRLKVTWPYGPVRCTSSIKLKRDELVKAVTEPKYSTKLDKHSVACTVERENDEPTQINFEFSPKIDFEKGKAVAAKMNWGKVEAPTLLKGAMWTATAADNTVNMLSSYLVTDINDFINNKCDEVKDEWSSRK
ncbi:MAG: hypothetical protein R3D51_01505 [Hyphomicrobiaceae bacterium]